MKDNDATTPGDGGILEGAGKYGEGFHLVAGVRPPAELEALEVSFGFSANVARKAGEALVRFGIFNADGQLALVCGLRGLVQSSEFASLVARLGYEGKGVFRGDGGGFDFAYHPGGDGDPTTTRSLLR